ncbi:unnamed protein product [Gordionus sp. m RMFG-2023]|uniref:pseudouridylate synthase TRUB2, mitochondrial-like n=1 Tax=Gordionus sp. m RMFG-2023 TaxID=3053472 RepID=UPI0030E2BAC5
MKQVLTYGPHAWNLLKGVFCIYKPPDLNMANVVSSLKNKISNELNGLEPRPPNKLEFYKEYIDLTTNKVETYKKEKIDLSDHILSVGARYVPEEIGVSYLFNSNTFMSGLHLVAINTIKYDIINFKKTRSINVYICTGKFGRATSDYTQNGITTQRKPFNHVSLTKLERILSIIKCNHRRELIKYSGVDDIRSQAAYTLASKGLLLNSILDLSPPIITDIKLLEFRPPYFSLEISAVNEFPAYLCQVIHDIGADLKSCSHSISMRRIQSGPFTIDHSLSSAEWNLGAIIHNIHNVSRPIYLQAIKEYRERHRFLKSLKLSTSQPVLSLTNERKDDERAISFHENRLTS